MKQHRQAFIAWPGWPLLTQAFSMTLLVTLLWLVVYYGSNWLTGLRTYRVDVHLAVDLRIPFVPPAALVYLSINLVFLPAPFVLRNIDELRALAMSLAAAIVLAGICFLLFPAELAYPSIDPGGWSGLFAFAQKCSLSYNLLPSLHVAMSVITLAAYSDHCGIAGKLMLGSWATAIATSTLLTHQHHVLDVVTGLALAAGIKWLIYDCWQALKQGDS